MGNRIGKTGGWGGVWVGGNENRKDQVGGRWQDFWERKLVSRASLGCARNLGQWKLQGIKLLAIEDMKSELVIFCNQVRFPVERLGCQPDT